MKNLFRRAFGGGGNLGDACLEPKTALEAAKQLGSEAAKRNLDAKMQRGEEAESVSEKAAISRHSEVRQNRKNPAYCNTKQLQRMKTTQSKQTMHLCFLASLHLNQFLTRLMLAGFLPQYLLMKKFLCFVHVPLLLILYL